MSPRYVLILADADDIHAAAVRSRILELYGDSIVPVVFDTLTFPLGSSVTWSLGQHVDLPALAVSAPAAQGVGQSFGAKLLESKPVHHAVRREDVCSVWWRRPRPSLTHPEVQEPEFQEFCRQNIRSLLLGFLDSCPGFNSPLHETRASRKPFQLSAARRAGLRVPETCITSRPEAAEKFIRAQWAEGKEVIYKPLVTGGESFAPTRRVREEDLGRLSRELLYSPVIFQNRIVGTDLRVAVVGDRVFAAAWKTDDPENLDIRLDANAAKTPYELRPEDEARLLDFHRGLGLAMGICDLKVDRDGAVVFLETNPSGQWLDLETEAGLPVSEAWRRVLVEGAAGSGVKATRDSYTLEDLATRIHVPYNLTVPPSILERFRA